MDDSGTETPRIAYKVFTFEESKKDTEESLSVCIPEVCLDSVINIIILHVTLQ